MTPGRGPLSWAQKWALLSLLLGVVMGVGAGCTAHPVRNAQPVSDYAGSWEYRYGDSPEEANGAYNWSLASNRDSAWQPTQTLEDPPGRNGLSFMWMRTRLVGPDLHEPVLFAVDIDSSYEAYIDGKLIDKFGPMQGRRYLGLPKVYLPLGPGYQGRTLTLRIYSPYSFIGLFGTPRLGGRAELVAEVIDIGMSPLMTGLFLMALGLVSLFLFALRTEDRLYLYYAGFALGLGAHIACRSLMRDFLLDLGPWWSYIELGGNAVGGASLCAFIGQLFGGGPLSVLRRVGQVLFAGFVLGVILVSTGTVHLWTLLRPLQSYFVIVVVSLIVSSIVAIRRGESDGKILGLGVLVAGGLTFFELLMVMNILPRWRLTISHYSSASVVLSMGVLLSLRFLRAHRRLQNYSTVLQLSLSQARVLEPGQHMQVALGEVLRLLGGDRALIFETSAEHKEPQLTAGRRSKGQPVGDEHDWDSTLISEVLRRRRPAVILRERDHNDLSSDRPPKRERLSIAAAPLLARGELIGVLYLESEATQHQYDKEDLEILLGLCNQLALTLMTTRAVRLELEGALARRRLAEQDALLQAAGQMARGDLTSVIAVPTSGELEPLAKALEIMRQDLKVKFQKLERSNSEIQQLNEELRRQIEHRSHRLMELVLRGERKGAASSVMPGRMLGEHYKVVRTLGKGAMGAVYEVERTTDQVRLAAKVLSEQSDRTALLRFAREAQILARLDHPNLVAISDIDITATGVLFLVMELVRGSTLKLARERYRDVAFASAVVRQIAAGLDAIHTRGIIHRDLKPANVLVSELEEGKQPLVKLADFGVSTLLSGQDDTTTEEGTPPSHMHISASQPPIMNPIRLALAKYDEANPDGNTMTALGVMDTPSLDADERALLTAADPLERSAPSQPDVLPGSKSGSQPSLQMGAKSGSQPSLKSGSQSGSKSQSSGRSASRSGEHDEHLTETGILVGTPMYMAPELSEGSRFARPPSDIFSLGVIAYELLTGEIPFNRPPVWARWRGSEAPAPSLATKRPELAPALIELVDSCLRLDPAQRPTAAAIAAALILQPLA